MREEYSLAGLSEADLAADWVTQFDQWLQNAIVAGLPEPNAMVLATAGPTGDVASRTVLCKGVDAAGVVFYTNLRSDKSRDLQANPRAAVTFPWIGLQRQVHLIAGSLALAGAILAWRVAPEFILLSGFVGAGLLLDGLTGFCGMARLLALMPWNRQSASV